MIFLIAASLTAAQTLGADPTAIVRKFLNKAIAGDARAYSLVSPGAAIAMNSIVTPMNRGTFSIWVQGCRVAGVTETADLYLGPDRRVAKAALRCSANGRSYDRRIAFTVAGTAITGASMLGSR